MAKGINWSKAKKRQTEPAFPEYNRRNEMWDPRYVASKSGPVKRLTRDEIQRLYGR